MTRRTLLAALGALLGTAPVVEAEIPAPVQTDDYLPTALLIDGVAVEVLNVKMEMATECFFEGAESGRTFINTLGRECRLNIEVPDSCPLGILPGWQGDVSLPSLGDSKEDEFCIAVSCMSIQADGRSRWYEFAA